MKHYRLAMVGFGNVGKQLVQILLDKTELLREQYGIIWSITGVATRRMGWLANPIGFDPHALLQGKTDGALICQDMPTWLQSSSPNVFFELSSLNPQTGQPALDYALQAMQFGAHVVTANKGVVVHGYHRLKQLGKQQQKHFMHESSVADGLPVFSLFRDTLPLARLVRVTGLLNSTTSVILADMEQGKSLAEAIQTAQALGITETDPSADIDGWDAVVKVIALATVLMDEPMTIDQVQREGIRGLTPADLQAARRDNMRYKLVSRFGRENGAVFASVRPERVPLASPMGAAGSEALLLQFETDVIPELTIMEDKAGPYTTAYGCLSDWIYIHTHPLG